MVLPACFRRGHGPYYYSISVFKDIGVDMATLTSHRRLEPDR